MTDKETKVKSKSEPCECIKCGTLGSVVDKIGENEDELYVMPQKSSRNIYCIHCMHELGMEYCEKCEKWTERNETVFADDIGEWELGFTKEQESALSDFMTKSKIDYLCNDCAGVILDERKGTK
ncbi:MAG: hypothetical protein LBD23_05455 [Oscillospiraceae bacterium]|nr:hypothetical protein [Oscillospiraceae bacterium]